MGNCFSDCKAHPPVANPQYEAGKFPASAKSATPKPAQLTADGAVANPITPPLDEINADVGDGPVSSLSPSDVMVTFASSDKDETLQSIVAFLVAEPIGDLRPSSPTGELMQPQQQQTPPGRVWSRPDSPTPRAQTPRASTPLGRLWGRLSAEPIGDLNQSSPTGELMQPRQQVLRGRVESRLISPTPQEPRAQTPRASTPLVRPGSPAPAMENSGPAASVAPKSTKSPTHPTGDPAALRKSERPAFTNETLRLALQRWFLDSAGATQLYGPIGEWDTSNVTDMSCLFSFKRRFDEDIGDWDTSKVVDMRRMFHCAERFNRDISKWDVSNVRSMSQMFHGSPPYFFDHPAQARCLCDRHPHCYCHRHPPHRCPQQSRPTMPLVSAGAKAFNRPLHTWDTSSVENMYRRACFAQSSNARLLNAASLARTGTACSTALQRSTRTSAAGPSPKSGP
jgi:surface protein